MFTEYPSNVASIQSVVMVEHNGVDDNLNIVGTQYKIPFAADQATLEISAQTTASGIMYNYVFKANVPRLQYAIKTIAESLYTRYVFFLTDNNGVLYKVGRKKKGYRIDVGGSITGDINTMSLGFSVNSKETFEIV